MRTFIFALLLLGLPVSFTGCQTGPQTVEAQRFNTFKVTWTTAHAAYQGYCELAVQGLVKPADQADIDAAWNEFRRGFKISFIIASQNWQAATPEDVEKLRDNLLTLIRSL